MEPDTNDSPLALWVKIAKSAGATVPATSDVRPVLVSLLTALLP